MEPNPRSPRAARPGPPPLRRPRPRTLRHRLGRRRQPEVGTGTRGHRDKGTPGHRGGGRSTAARASGGSVTRGGCGVPVPSPRPCSAPFPAGRSSLLLRGAPLAPSPGLAPPAPAAPGAGRLLEGLRVLLGAPRSRERGGQSRGCQIPAAPARARWAVGDPGSRGSCWQSCHPRDRRCRAGAGGSIGGWRLPEQLIHPGGAPCPVERVRVAAGLSLDELPELRERAQARESPAHRVQRGPRARGCL